MKFPSAQPQMMFALLVSLLTFSAPLLAVTASDITADIHNTFATSLGDVDDDGDLDLIAGNIGEANRLYLNDGNGVLGDGAGGTTGSNITAGAHNTAATSLGDVDGDGDLDLIVGNNGEVNRLYLNDGNGVFGDGLGGTTGSDITADDHGTYTTSLGDVDGDGDLDLIAGNYNQVNRLYINQGGLQAGTEGDFDAGSDITADAHQTFATSLGDVDGDGDLDLVVGNYGPVNRLYLNDGNGVFGDGLGGTTGSDISADAHSTAATSLTDVDGDGDLDLVAGNWGLNRLYLNLGGTGASWLGYDTGSNISADTSSTFATSLGDVDGDGDLDLIAGNYNQVNRLYINQGGLQAGTEGNFDAGSDINADADATTATSLGDVDGDGHLDLIAGNEQVNRLYLNLGSALASLLVYDAGSNVTPLDYTSATSLGDVDGDGDLDLIVANIYEANRLYLNQGGLQAGSEGDFGTGSDVGWLVDYTSATSLGDVDGDGDLDLVASIYGGVNRLYLNDGKGVFGDGAGNNTGSDISNDAHNTRATSLGDVDGDGDLDLVVGNYGQVNRLYLNDGKGVFGDGLGGTTGSDITTDTHSTYATSLGDVDGDGDLDLVVGNAGQANRLYLNDGNGVFGDGLGGTTGSDISTDTSSTYATSLGDVDGDGDLDLIAGNAGVNRLYLNDGNGVFGDGLGGTTGSDITADAHATNATSLGDVDGDGDLDLIVGNNGVANRLYLNDGNGVFGDGAGGTTGSDITADGHLTNATSLGDVDGDGDLDLIAGNDSGQANRLYLNRASEQLFLRVWTSRAITRIESTTVVDISVACIGSTSGAASLDYHFKYGTALAPDFYPYLTSGTLSWADGQCASKTIPLPIFNDNLFEGTESLELVFDNPVNLYNGDPISQVKKTKITILDDEADSDGDGVVDALDAFPNDYTKTVSCSAGSYGFFTCVAADLGNYVPTDGATAQILCAPGKYADQPGLTSCINAPLGTYIDTIGASAAIDCSLGQYSDVTGSTSCNVAPAGSYVPNTGASTVTYCAAGTYVGTTLYGSTFCNDAPLGSSVPVTGASTYTNCAPGTYADTTGSVSCIPAELGRYVPNSSAIAAVSCATGTYADTSGSTSCTVAPIGSYVPVTGASTFTNCAAGTYANTTGSVSCIPAELGRYVPNSSAIAAVSCAAGTYADTTGLTSCITAPIGSYVDSVEASAALSCTVGFSTISTGSTSISDCLVDTDLDSLPDTIDPDIDGDGIANADDTFPNDSTESIDTDGDGIGNNADTDDDGDGVPDANDPLPLDPTIYLLDTDGDGAPDISDAFPADSTESVDTDGDGIGNNTDTDDDGDGVLDVDDFYPLDNTLTAEKVVTVSSGALNLWLLALMLPLLTAVRRRS